jgi:hypothetical protein
VQGGVDVDFTGNMVVCLAGPQFHRELEAFAIAGSGSVAHRPAWVEQVRVEEALDGWCRGGAGDEHLEEPLLPDPLELPEPLLQQRDGEGHAALVALQPHSGDGCPLRRLQFQLYFTIRCVFVWCFEGVCRERIYKQQSLVPAHLVVLQVGFLLLSSSCYGGLDIEYSRYVTLLCATQHRRESGGGNVTSPEKGSGRAWWRGRGLLRLLGFCRWESTPVCPACVSVSLFPSLPRRLHATMTACCSRFLRRSCKRACRWIAVRPSSLVSTTRVVGSVLLLYGSVSSVAMPCTVVEYSVSLRCVAAKVKTLCTPRELWEQKVPVELDYFCVHPSPAVMSSCDCMNVRVGGSGSRKSPLNLTISASVHRPVLNSD